MVIQVEIILAPRERGFSIITEDILKSLPELPETGLLNLFIQHTSAGLIINENYDSDVRVDLNSIFDRLISERESYYMHTVEGSDDMPAHAKSAIVGASINIPIKNKHLNMGIWQGIYLCEFRNNGGARKIIATIIY